MSVEKMENLDQNTSQSDDQTKQDAARSTLPNLKARQARRAKVERKKISTEENDSKQRRSNIAHDTSTTAADTKDHVFSYQEIKDAVECVICLGIPRNPVYQCDNGHILCHICHDKVDVCPLCRVILRSTRVLAVERVLAKCPRPCEFDIFGCDIKLTANEFESHERYCDYRPCRCPQFWCKKLIPIIELIAHIESDHGNTFLKRKYSPSFRRELFNDVKDVMNMSRQPFYPPLLLEFDGYYFISECFRADSGNWYTWFYMAGSSEQCRKYIFTIKLIHANNIEELSYTGYCTSLYDEKDKSNTLAQALKFDDGIVNHFCCDNSHVAYDYQIRRSPVSECTAMDE